jgi:hypothetical protein
MLIADISASAAGNKPDTGGPRAHARSEVVGANDTNFLAATDYMAAKIQGSTKVVIPDAGHAANLHQPAAFNRAMNMFLAGLAAQSASMSMPVSEPILRKRTRQAACSTSATVSPFLWARSLQWTASPIRISPGTTASRSMRPAVLAGGLAGLAHDRRVDQTDQAASRRSDIRQASRCVGRRPDVDQQPRDDGLEPTRAVAQAAKHSHVRQARQTDACRTSRASCSSNAAPPSRSTVASTPKPSGSRVPSTWLESDLIPARKNYLSTYGCIARSLIGI